MKNNSITRIHENAFYSLKIVDLFLANNNITFLNKEMFNGSVLMETLDVSGNNLRCDCNMFKFLKPLSTKQVTGACSYPPVFAGQDLKSFTKNNISCTSCSNIPCKNNATCKPIDEKRFICSCEKGYIGSLCENVDYCYNVTCEHNSTCSVRNNSTGFLCNCSQGFDGDTCNKEIPCFKNYCENNGICKKIGTASYKCNCIGRYYGKHCEKIQSKKQKQRVLRPGWVTLIITLILTLIIVISIIIVIRRRNCGSADITETTPLLKISMNTGKYRRISDIDYRRIPDTD